MIKLFNKLFRTCKEKPKSKNSNAGFTLIEIALVILILAVLMYLIVPTGGLRDTARVQSLAKKIEIIYISAQDCMIRNGGYDFKQCSSNEQLLPYLPYAARDTNTENADEFWSTPWSNGDSAITVSQAADDAGSIQIAIDLTGAPTPQGDEPSIGSQLASYLKAKAKNVEYTDTSVTVTY